MSAVLLLAGCVNELPDEQFDKYVLFTHNGWVEQGVEFTSSNTVEIPVAVSISGTSSNNDDVTVSLKYDSELLDRYNKEKYKSQEGLYYTLVPEEAISISTNVTIAAGEESAVTMLVVDFSKISDPYKDYVLPLSIEKTSKYSLQARSVTASLSRSEVLYNIRRVNRFSGNYTGSGTVSRTNNIPQPGGRIIYEPRSGTGMPVASKTLYAISNDECYFYAGHIDRNNPDRDKFIVHVRLDEKDSLIFSSPIPELLLNADASYVRKSANPLVLGTQSTFTTFYRPFANDIRYQTVTREFRFCYLFYDVVATTPPTPADNHMFVAEGILMLEKRELKQQE